MSRRTYINSISTVKREVDKLKAHLTPKKPACFAFQESDGSFKVCGITYACVEDYEGDAELILLKWSDP